jgi:hypothetical protein
MRVQATKAVLSEVLTSQRQHMQSEFSDYVKQEFVKSRLKEQLKRQQEKPAEQKHHKTIQERWQSYKTRFQQYIGYKTGTIFNTSLEQQKNPPIKPVFIKTDLITDYKDAIDKSIILKLKIILNPSIPEKEKLQVVTTLVKEAFPESISENPLRNYARAKALQALAIIADDYKWAEKFGIAPNRYSAEVLYKEILTIPGDDLLEVKKDAQKKLETLNKQI